jgi:hypothetical protein
MPHWFDTQRWQSLRYCWQRSGAVHCGFGTLPPLNRMPLFAAGRSPHCSMRGAVRSSQ